MMPSVYRISLDDDPVETVRSLAEIDLFGEDALPGVYDIDVIRTEPIEGLTSWRWGTLTKHVHGVITIEDSPRQPDHRC